MDLKLWWFALQKPVKENDKRVWDSFDVIAKWLISTRATVTQLTLMAGVMNPSAISVEQPIIAG